MQVRGIVVGALSALMICTRVLAEAPGSGEAVALSIPAEPLGESLKDLARQSGLQLLFSSHLVADLRGPEVKGTYSVNEALKRLLSNTKLRFEFVNPHTVTILAMPPPDTKGGGAESAGPAPADSGSSGAVQKTNTAEVGIRDMNKRNLFIRLFGAAAVCGTALHAGEACAQEAGDAEVKLEEIVVTGTLVRGIAPPGANVITATREDIVATGASNTVDLVAQIPQLATFGTLTTTSGNAAAIANPPQIRQLPTLVLVDGRRLVSQGVIQQATDVSVIPSNLIERVEVITGSGSALYGSDAIGGVINFITRDHIEGVEVNARRGFASGYNTVNADIDTGHSWDSGSFVIGYSYAHNTNLSGADRDWFSNDRSKTGTVPPLSLSCNPGNVTVGSTVYSLPGFTPGARLCDLADNYDIYPADTRHNVYAKFEQHVTDNATLSISAYYAHRLLQTRGIPAFNTSSLNASGTITSANPYFHPIGRNTQQTVNFSLAPVAGPYGGDRGDVKLESYGVTPQFELKFGRDLRAVLSGNFGHSNADTFTPSRNDAALATALAGTTTATAFNPYDVASTNAAVVGSVLNWADIGLATQKMREFRLTLDGTIFHLAGGDTKIAVGFENHYEEVVARLGTGISTFVPPPFPGDRTYNSVFGELVVPVVGPQNAITGVQALSLSAAGRYDHYSDFGNTFNPKFGLSWNPITDLRLRSDYGRSFHAPQLTDSQATEVSVVDLPFSFLALRSGDGAFANRPELFVAGGNPKLGPEKARSWSLGGDWTPAMIDGLRVSATYYNVVFTDAINIPPVFNVGSNPAALPYFIFFPTLAQAQADLAGLRIGSGRTLASYYTDPNNTPYAIVHAQRANLSSVKQSGLDFDVAYTHKTGFGSINMGVAASYKLKLDTQPDPGSPPSSDLDTGTPRYSVQGTFGANVGQFSGQLRIDHLSRAHTPLNAAQTSIASFTTINLFGSYNMSDLLPMKNAQLTLNVDNLFNKDPPYRSTNAFGAAFYNLGRVVTLGVRTAFLIRNVSQGPSPTGDGLFKIGGSMCNATMTTVAGGECSLS